MQNRRKGGGGKLGRSEIVSVRLDPRTLFGAELAAARQRRTVSSLIECAVEAYIEQINVTKDVSVAQVVQEVWHVEEADRFAMLAFSYPNMLTHDQDHLWDFICNYPILWRGRWQDNVWVYEVKPDTLLFNRLRRFWSQIVDVVKGELPGKVLPKIERWYDLGVVDPEPIRRLASGKPIPPEVAGQLYRRLHAWSDDTEDLKAPDYVGRPQIEDED